MIDPGERDRHLDDGLPTGGTTPGDPRPRHTARSAGRRGEQFTKQASQSSRSSRSTSESRITSDSGAERQSITRTTNIATIW
jgi:hypothetical protein